MRDKNITIFINIKLICKIKKNAMRSLPCYLQVIVSLQLEPQGT